MNMRTALVFGVAALTAHGQVQPLCPSCAYTTYAAGQTYTVVVPSNVTYYEVHLWGGAGGASALESSATGGAGAYVTGFLLVSPGETLTLTVGSGGATCCSTPTFGGGGSGSACGGMFGIESGGCGGGVTTIMRGSQELATAGGGGGGGYTEAPNDMTISQPTLVICPGGAAAWTGCAQAGFCPEEVPDQPAYGAPGCPDSGGAGSPALGGSGGSAFAGGGGDPQYTAGGGSGHFGGAFGIAGGGGSSFTDGLIEASGMSGNYPSLPTNMAYYVAGIAQGGNGAGGDGMAVLVEIPAGSPVLPSPSSTPSSTATPTNTPTSMPTPSVTAMSTGTPSNTPSCTATQTISPTVTNTPSVSSSGTSSRTPSASVTIPPTGTPTPSTTPMMSLQWPQFGGGSTKAASQCSPHGVGPVSEEPAPLWSFAAGSCQGVLPYCSSTPLVGSDGTIYVASGSWLGALSRFGKVLWQAPPPPVPDFYATPAFSEADGVFVVAGWSGNVTGYAMATGEVLWQTILDQSAPQGVSMLTLDGSTSPASVYFVTAQSCLVRFNVATGVMTGQSCLTSDSTINPPGAAMSQSGTRIVTGFALPGTAGDLQFIRGFNLTDKSEATLQLDWSTSIRGMPGGATQTIDSGFAYSTTLDTFFVAALPGTERFNPPGPLLIAVTSNGTLVFSIQLSSAVLGSPAISCDGTVVYVLDAQGGLSAYSGATGAQKWTAYIPIVGAQSTPLVGADGTLYITGVQAGTNYAGAVSSTGQILWEVNPTSALAGDLRGNLSIGQSNITANALEPSPVLLGAGLLLVATRDGTFTVYA